MRAAEITYLPGGTLAIPDNDLGRGKWETKNIPFRRPDPPAFPGRYAESILPLSVAATRAIDSYATIPLFDGVQDVNPLFMNQRVTSKRKSYLSPYQPSVFQPYPDPPVTWKAITGAPSRFDMR